MYFCSFTGIDISFDSFIPKLILFSWPTTPSSALSILSLYSVIISSHILNGILYSLIKVSTLYDIIIYY